MEKLDAKYLPAMRAVGCVFQSQNLDFVPRSTSSGQIQSRPLPLVSPSGSEVLFYPGLVHGALWLTGSHNPVPYRIVLC